MAQPSHPRKPTAPLRRRVAGPGRVILGLLIVAVAGCSDSPSAPRTGSLSITVSGLPAGAQNAITVTGPSGSGYTRGVSTTETLGNLVPGLYTVAANTVSLSTGTYTSATPSQQVQVSSGGSASASVSYAIATGSIAVNVTGLPQGTAAAISITGPGGYNRQLSESATISVLQPGTYQVSSSSVSEAAGHVYSPVPLAQVVNVTASETPKAVTAGYTLATGALEVAITGLPGQASADVTITGPAGYSSTVAASSTLVGLFPGTYTVIAHNVGTSPTYAPTPGQQNLDVVASLTPAHASIAYLETTLPPPEEFNLSIEGMYITQAVQNFASGVPLIAGMPGLVRVFVKASAPNTVSATVRVRLYQGLSLSQTITLLPDAPGVPTSISEGTIGSSWNAVIPASLIQPGLRVLADVDPANAVTEANESDNAFPSNGIPLDPRVEITTPLNLTVVPVAQTSTGLTGNVTTSNVGAFMNFARKMLPIRDYNVTVRVPFTTSTPPVESNNGNNSWLQILGEIDALRVAEGTADYYMGVVGTQYNSGVAGYAYAPGRTSVIWDRLPSASPVAAHELAHNLGRLHAPCGGAANPDPWYPYVFGIIGVYGYDIETGGLKPPGTSDLMGYCGYGWISDYTYTGILNYRLSTSNGSVSPRTLPFTATESFVQSKDVRRTLVVWGRIESGRLVLEPAFRATTRPVLPARPGPYRVEGRSADGRAVFSYAFEGQRPADADDPAARLFAFAIPIDERDAQSVVNISLTSQSGERAERVISGAGPGSPGALQAVVGAPGTIRFRLTDPATQFAVVRERASQRIVAFVRGQAEVAVRSRAMDFDVEFSDGVRSRGLSVRAIRR